MMRRGCDVSHWQKPSPSLAASRRSAGDEFVFIKATDGLGSTDRAMAAHWANFVGFLRGAYHFYRSWRSPAVQARQFIAAMTGRTWELPPALDFENASRRANPDDLLLFLHLVEQWFGRTPVLYTGPAWWSSTIGNDGRFARFPLWLAAYPGITSPPEQMRSAPAPWPRVTIWQWTSAGGLDRNVVSAEDLAMLQGRGVPTSPAKWAPPAYPGRPLYPGDVSQDVAVFALGLHLIGYRGFSLRGSSAKVYGAGKVRSVKRFQRRHHLTDDGIVGPVTWKVWASRLQMRHDAAARKRKG